MARQRKEAQAKAPAPVQHAQSSTTAPVAMPNQPQLMPQPTAASLSAMPQAMPQGQPVNPAIAGNIVINREQYIQVRDSVHSRLCVILGMLRDFASDYMRQSSMLLGEPSTLDNLSSFGIPQFNAAALLANPLDALVAAPPAPVVDDKKERKKRQHDPNAPKRPLTPYFLYMVTARPIIAKDLGNDVPKGAVQDEGQRRWASMDPAEKQLWNNHYKFNLRLYNARVHSYKAGNKTARDMTDEDALAYAEVNSISVPAAEEAHVSNDPEGIAEQLQAADEIQSPVEESKTPKAKSTRKRKSGAAAEVEEEPKDASPASPPPKRKRKSAAAVDVPSEEPKKSTRKKKSS